MTAFWLSVTFLTCSIVPSLHRLSLELTRETDLDPRVVVGGEARGVRVLGVDMCELLNTAVVRFSLWNLTASS